MLLRHTFSVFITKYLFISLADAYLTVSQLTSSIKYNASEMPQNSITDKGNKAPLEITVSIEIQNVDEVTIWEEGGILLKIGLKVKLSWYDNRLNYTDRDLQTYIFTKDEKAIWTPCLVSIIEKKGKIDPPYTFFRIYPNALVEQFVLVSFVIQREYSSGTTRGFSFRLLSLNHTVESLTLEWNRKNPVKIADDSKQHRAAWTSSTVDFQARTCHISVTRLSRKQGGVHSCLEIYTDENPSNSITVYASGISLVIISWSCFWMAPSTVLGRVAVLLCCLLHFFIQKVFIAKDSTLLKNVTILKSFIDGCLVFIFSAFFQTIWITYLYRTTRTPGVTRLSSATTIQEEEEEGIVENSDGEANTLCNHFPRIWFNRFPSTPDAINAICRVGFPVCFVIFVCAFFAVVN